MKKTVALFLIFKIISITTFAQTIERTSALEQNIKTLQIKRDGDFRSLPVINLGSDETLQFSFDELTHDSRSLSYSVQMCNAKWEIENLAESEYISGFANGYIDDYETSRSTTVLYTHYKFSLPNDNTQFKLSGNYVVNVYEDNEPEKTVAKFCFSILDAKAKIEGVVRSNTDIELNGGYQQLDFSVDCNLCKIQDPMKEISVVVRQNERMDNEAKELKPTFISGHKLEYKNNRKLIFEGGSEYRRFDFTTRFSADPNVEKVQFIDSNFNVFLYPNGIRGNEPWIYDQDLNGAFNIHNRDAYDSDIEADYMYVHFSLIPNGLLPKGKIFIGGKWNYNLLDNSSQMEYDKQKNIYKKTLLLKQGAYNYQHWFVPEKTNKVEQKMVDGSYWQTENRYVIYLYHRPFGGRYDQLIGMKILEPKL